MRTKRFSKIGLLALCALVGFFLVSPSSAGPFTAVSNLSEATDNVIGYDEATFVFASSFHTSASSFSLASLTALLTNGDAITHNFEARIYADSSGKPGSLLCTFSDNHSLPSGVGETPLTFSSASYTFSPNTTYWMAVKTLEDTNTITPGVVLTSSGDQSSPVGWTIGDNSFTYSFDNGNSWTNYASYTEKFSIDVTPEPATISLLVMGGMTLLARRRRKF